MVCDINNTEQKVLNNLINFKDKSILEIGCGNGRYLDLIDNSFKSYLGIDINSDAIVEAKNNYTASKCNFVCSDFIKYDFKDLQYDLIILCLTFHEFSAEFQGIVLFKILSLLNKGGRLIIIDPTTSKNSFQAMYNVAYNNYKFFNHNLDLKHSYWVLQKAQDNKLIKLIDKKNLNIDFAFSSIKEIVDMLIEDNDLSMLNWTNELESNLYQDIANFINNFKLMTNNQIIIYDKLQISIFEKEK